MNAVMRIYRDVLHFSRERIILEFQSRELFCILYSLPSCSSHRLLSSSICHHALSPILHSLQLCLPIPAIALLRKTRYSNPNCFCTPANVSDIFRNISTKVCSPKPMSAPSGVGASSSMFERVRMVFSK